MNGKCMVCNARGPPSKNYIKNVFSDLNTLLSGSKLLDILQEILDRVLDEDSCHSKLLCRKCYKACTDYDLLKSKMNIIKLAMADEYLTTLQSSPTELPIVKEEKAMGTIVVPASKLVPVPADFQLNFRQLAGFGQMASYDQLTSGSQVASFDQIVSGGKVHVSRANVASNSKSTPLINLKVTIGSSVFTQSLLTSNVKISKSPDTIGMTNTVTSTKESNLSGWNISSVPTDIFSTNDEASQNAEENDVGNDKADENEMEIDEDCTLTAIPVTSHSEELTFDLSNIKTENAQLSDDSQYINVSMLPVQDDGTMVTADGNYVFSKLKILHGSDDNDDGDQHTIVVEGDNASLLDMMGQKLIYENGELSLVMYDDQLAHGDDDDADDDGQDSNEESQIELQVSGDEETANAIIAAAQEQGGAFIKVESGEMYRVKSVQSAPEPPPVDAPEAPGGEGGVGGEAGASHDISALVIRDGNHYRCRLCKTPEGTASDEVLDALAMMSHMRAEHGAALFLCQLCGAALRRRREYTAHIADHSKKLASHKGNSSLKPKLHECTICKKTYNSRTLLQEHMNTHTGTRPYQCGVCKKAFASKYTYQSHLKTHQVRPRPYKCNQCGKSFLSQTNLTQHERTHTGVKEFVCNVCNKAFGSQHNLDVHGVVHSGERPHACSQCGKAFARRAELTDHRRVHTGERPFACETCGARFAQRSNLHSHRRATHLHDKRHHCTHCSKRFKRRRLLEYHIKATHTGERPLKCDVCHSTFVYPEHYKKHIRIHSGERPYFCEICGKSFNSRDNRNTHRFTHSDKKPYECLACGNSYMRKRQLIAHMNLSGHLAESIVVNQPRVTRVHNPENGVTTLMQRNDKDQIQNNEDKPPDVVFRTSGKLELLDGTSGGTQNDSQLLGSDNLEGETEDDILIEAVNSTQVDGQAAQLVTSATGSVLRLIQVQMPDGNDGWVALND